MIMVTRNSHGQLTLTGFVGTLNATDSVRFLEILRDSGLSTRVSVKRAVTHPNIITRYKFLAYLLQYDANNEIPAEEDVIEDTIDVDSQNVDTEPDTTEEVDP